tara:strand:+ start:10872 stop:11261 length:390 start_codon:yes stop_codon:yes gene_type:complete
MKFRLLLITVIIIVYSIYLIFQKEKKTILTIDANFNTEKDYVSKEDERIFNIWDSGKYFIINKSNETLVLDPIRYGAYKKEFDKYKKISLDTGITILDFSPFLSYVFEEPPTYSKGPMEGIIKWYLHKE